MVQQIRCHVEKSLYKTCNMRNTNATRLNKTRNIRKHHKQIALTCWRKTQTIHNKCVNILENRDSPLAHTHTHTHTSLTGSPATGDPFRVTCHQQGFLCFAVLCYALLCYAVLCLGILCYTLLCCAMFCYAKHSKA